MQVVNALIDPFRNGVRAVGSAVIAVPDTVFDGVTRVGDGINKAAKQMLGVSDVVIHPNTLSLFVA